MYFFTKENRGIYAIGIHDNYVFGLGEKNKKLVIYQKAVLDACDWKIFYKTNIHLTTLPFPCKCVTRIHAGGSIIDSKIWVISEEMKSCRCITLDIRTKKVIDYKKADRGRIFPIFCLKCSNPLIRPHGFVGVRPRYMIILENKNQCESNFPISVTSFIINETENTFYFMTQNKYKWSPRFGIGNNAEMICVKKRKYGFIKSFLMKTVSRETTIENVFGEWEDIIFYHDNTNLCCLTKTKNLAENNFKINVYIVKIFITERSLNFIFQFSFVVDLNFPSFFTTKIFMAPNTFIISTPNGLLTILNRMLTLSEYSFVSLLKVPDSRKSLIIKETILEKLMKIMKLRKKTEIKTWMSLNFIKDVLSLPNSFSLLSLSDY